ncbi:S-adenosyl-L-methionine-dependent methyltransferase [Nemania sp. FL0916]|nr:S-adenosyl-L-methionine-dependent methyltransferase [Nemania sp. FL0916]
MAARSLKQLSDVISQNAALLSRKLESRGLSDLTVRDVKALSPSELDGVAAAELANAARELQALVLSPAEQLNMLSFSCHDASSVGTLLMFDIPKLVPLHGSIALGKLAVLSGLHEDKLARIIRYATTNFIFCEPSPGHVAHTALSAALTRDQGFAAFLRLALVDLAPISVALPRACSTWPQSEEPTQCGVNVAYDTAEPFFTWLSRDPALQMRFDKGMAGFSGENGGAMGGRSEITDVTAYPWATKLPAEAVIVDVGGGYGHISRALKKAFPSFRITVQDRSEVIDAVLSSLLSSGDDLGGDGDNGNNATVSSHLGIAYQAHNFFDPQPLVADAYFLRQIIHDWPQRECVAILRALIPALKPGARVLVSEYIVPSPEELAEPGRIIEAKIMRELDLQVMAELNSKERTKDEFIALFSEADPRLRFSGTYQIPEDRKSCILEAVWEP